MEIENLPDIDSDNGSPSEFNDYLDNKTLEYFPEPFSTIAQFILSTISGIMTSYIEKQRANKSINYIENINTYFNYCRTTDCDNYIIEIADNLKLDIKDDKEILNKILDDIENITTNIFNVFINTKLDNIYKSEDNFDIDTFNINVLKNLIPMIKYSMISHININYNYK